MSLSPASKPVPSHPPTAHLSLRMTTQVRRLLLSPSTLPRVSSDAIAHPCDVPPPHASPPSNSECGAPPHASRSLADILQPIVPTTPSGLLSPQFVPSSQQPMKPPVSVLPRNLPLQFQAQSQENPAQTGIHPLPGFSPRSLLE